MNLPGIRFKVSSKGVNRGKEGSSDGRRKTRMKFSERTCCEHFTKTAEEELESHEARKENNQFHVKMNDKKIKIKLHIRC